MYKESALLKNNLKRYFKHFKKAKPSIHELGYYCSCFKSYFRSFHLDFWNKMHKMEGMENKKGMVLPLKIRHCKNEA